MNLLLAIASAMLAIADTIRKATEHLAEITGPALGGLLSVRHETVSKFILSPSPPSPSR